MVKIGGVFAGKRQLKVLEHMLPGYFCKARLSKSHFGEGILTWFGGEGRV